MRITRWKIYIFATFTLVGCAQLEPVQQLFWSKLPQNYMVAAAHPDATAAGVEMLERGGSAVDAAIAIQMMLTLVEPESSGIGGGAFMVYWDPETKTLENFDGRETAPASATPHLFLKTDGTAKPHFEKVLGGKSVGVPGVMAMLEMAHKEHGKLPWAELFQPAIDLARKGFAVSPKLNKWLTMLPTVGKMPDTAAYFLPGGRPYSVGETIQNEALAKTLEILAAEGAQAFYKGPIADAIIGTVSKSPVAATPFTQADLSSYEPLKRDPICGPYRRFTICTAAPPAGGLVMLEIMGMLESFDLPSFEPGGVEAVHVISEASRLGFADRGRYLADPAFAEIPIGALLDASYLAERAKLISMTSSLGKAAPGNPSPKAHASLWGEDASIELPSTSHMSILDADGGALSMTSTVEFALGSHLMTGGFILNNQLTDFSSVPVQDGSPVANAVAAGKRPRSAMSPTIVFDEKGEVYMLIGAPGGSKIIGYVVKTLVGVLDWDLDPQTAINMPNHINRNGVTEIEKGPNVAALKAGLEALGHEVSVRGEGSFGGLSSGLQGIRVRAHGIEGAADPRRTGNAIGG